MMEKLDGISSDYVRYEFLRFFLNSQYKLNLDNELSFLELESHFSQNGREPYRYLQFVSKHRSIAIEIGRLFRGINALPLKPLQEFIELNCSDEDCIVGTILALQDWIAQETILNQTYLPSKRYVADFCMAICKMIEALVCRFPVETHEVFLNELTKKLQMQREFDEEDQLSYSSFDLKDFGEGERVTLRMIPDCQLGNVIGLKSWPASFLLADFLVKNRERLVDGKSLLELGSGCGLVGAIVSNYLKPLRFIVTDFQEIVCDNLQFNLDLNVKGREEVHQVALLDWFDDNSVLLRDLNSDIMVASDVIYSPDLIEPLLNVMINFLSLGEKKEVYIVNAVRNEDTFKEFLKSAQSMDLLLEIIYDLREEDIMDHAELEIPRILHWKSDRKNLVIMRLVNRLS
jgi:hypothetical protein